jgi:predicted DNA-binding helix-hairpin-helix protein
VGGVGESDLELLSTSERLLKDLRLQRVYYSSFTPIKETPMEHLPAANPLRQHRLYQSSFLFRDYGYDLEELPFDRNGNLPLDEDPKLAWARANLSERPLELNQASREELLRVPGIGPLGVEKIINARRQGKIRSAKDLKALGVATKRLESYVLFDGHQPHRQLALF